MTSFFMKKVRRGVLLSSLLVASLFLFFTNSQHIVTVYDFAVKDPAGRDVPMSDFKGKVLLIVNSATRCGLTPQYQGLQELYLRYRDSGFEILDFPCNQFAKQAPETDEGIATFCELNYKTTFRRFAKVEVNGKNADPLFKYLKKQRSGIFGSSIKWNFTKFLVDRDGNVVGRYSPTTKPCDIARDIETLLQKKNSDQIAGEATHSD